VSHRLPCCGFRPADAGDGMDSKLLPKAKVVDNHLLIDPAAGVFDRTDEEYRPLRQVLVRTSVPELSSIGFIF